MQIKPRAFVVMAYGKRDASTKDGSTVCVDFDELYERLLKPGLERAGCEPFRADEEKSAGNIHTDMFFELVTADVVLVDISSANLNVYYELGVRHAVHPDGAIVFHGGGVKLPFNISNDRVFTYDGALWHENAPRDEEWARRVELEAVRFAATVRACLEGRDQTTGSPLYKQLPGLKPVDWTKIDTARARYFYTEHEDWKKRVDVARREKRVSDILTLAEDAPTRYHQRDLLRKAANSLVELEQYRFALAILEEILADSPDDLDARCRRGLVLNRLGRAAEAEAEADYLKEHQEGHPEVQGLLGRIYKDLWIKRWIDLGTLQERQETATYYSQIAKSAVESYRVAACRDLNSYYTGINMLTLTALLLHLQEKGHAPSLPDEKMYDGLVGVVQCAANHALSHAALDDEERIWASSTLGELALLQEGQPAASYYRNAATHTKCSTFQLTSMLAQLRMMLRLGFKKAETAKCIEVLEQSKKHFSATVEYEKVIVFSGHMIDVKDRNAPRFPQEKADAVKAKLEEQLTQFDVKEGDLALCGGACGGDVLFAEACLARGAAVRLLISLPQDEFISESVRRSEGDWVQRFHNLVARCEVWYQHERLGKPPRQATVFERNNRWMLNVARVHAQSGKLFALRVWDGKNQGDGPGGTAHFSSLVEKMGATLAASIDPMKL
jgi:tetratricopeptide (TPR) repeat protein